MKFITKLKHMIWKFNEKRWLCVLRKRNKNKTFSLITNNCIGGIIYHNLGIQFLTPTINLFIPGEDFLAFVKDTKYYSTCELIETKTDKKYPVGKLVAKDLEHKDVTVHFQHYDSFEYAKKKWIERFQRVNYDNLFYMWEFYDDVYDIELLKKYDTLSVRKIAILHRSIEGIKHFGTVSCYNNGKPIGKILKPKGISGKRFLDEFDYVEFLSR